MKGPELYITIKMWSLHWLCTKALRSLRFSSDNDSWAAELIFSQGCYFVWCSSEFRINHWAQCELFFAKFITLHLCSLNVVWHFIPNHSVPQSLSATLFFAVNFCFSYYENLAVTANLISSPFSSPDQPGACWAALAPVKIPVGCQWCLPFTE